MRKSALCRSRRERSNAYFLANVRFDTAENEPSGDVDLVPRQAPGVPAATRVPRAGRTWAVLLEPDDPLPGGVKSGRTNLKPVPTFSAKFQKLVQTTSTQILCIILGIIFKFFEIFDCFLKYYFDSRVSSKVHFTAKHLTVFGLFRIALSKRRAKTIWNDDSMIIFRKIQKEIH